MRTDRWTPWVLCLVTLLTCSFRAEAQTSEPQAAEEFQTEEPWPRLILKGFGNIDFEKRSDETPGSFLLGELDFFITSQLADELSVLAEVVIEPGETHTSDVVVDVERFQIKFAPWDALSIAAGRMHSALGFWNQTFHHGAWFQTTVGRPEIYAFEDEGGVLPVHEVGLQLSGSAPVRALQVEYNLSVTNGRGPSRYGVVLGHDPNSAKAVNLWIALSPRGQPGFKLGGAARFDTIPADPQSRPAMDERLLSGFLAYQQGRGELIAEVIAVRHEEAETGRRFELQGGYLQAAWRFGHFKPYYRFDRLDHDVGDPFYAPDATDITLHALGLRVDPWNWTCLKLEASRERTDPGRNFWVVSAQAAFTF